MSKLRKYKKLLVALFVFILVPMLSGAYVTLNNKTWTSYSVLTAADLETYVDDNLDLLNAGLDSVINAIRDSVATVILDSLLAHKADIADSLQSALVDEIYFDQANQDIRLYRVSANVLGLPDTVATYHIKNFGTVGMKITDSGGNGVTVNDGGIFDFDSDPQVSSIGAWIDSTNVTGKGIGSGSYQDNSITSLAIRDATIDSTDIKDTSIGVSDLPTTPIFTAVKSGGLYTNTADGSDDVTLNIFGGGGAGNARGAGIQLGGNEAASYPGVVSITSGNLGASYGVIAISGGDVNVGNSYDVTPGSKLDVNGDSIRIRTAQTPLSGGAGNQGEIAWDASYIYVCTGTNAWERVAITGGY